MAYTFDQSSGTYRWSRDEGDDGDSRFASYARGNVARYGQSQPGAPRLAGGPQDANLQKYSKGNLQATLSPAEYEQYLALNSAFRQAYGAGNFGDFDYYDYLTNPETQRIINETMNAMPTGAEDRRPMKQKALQDLIDFFQRRSGGPQGFNRIDIGGLIDPLRAESNQLADTALQTGRARISQAFEGGTERATEALAGTGLGRSGVGVETILGSELRRSAAQTAFENDVEMERANRQYQLAVEEMKLKLSEDLAQRGYEQGFIEDAQKFQEALLLQSFQNAANYDPGSWLDTVGSVVDIGVDLASIIPGPWQGLALAGNVAQGGTQILEGGEGVPRETYA